MKSTKTLSKARPKAGSGEYATDTARWRAVLQRDIDADGKFYYSVRTTGIYCRPFCAARRARRENVQFHSSCEAAERAGFRACQRCRPHGSTLVEEHTATIAAACRTIEAAKEIPILDELAKSAGMSRFHFHRVFTKIAGLTPKAYATAHRAERMRNSLSKHRTVTGAVYDAGFNSSSRFYEDSTRMLGMKPKSFREGGPGETIRFAVGECSLGSILVAASENGVCTILLGDDPNDLGEELQDRFPKARLIGGGKKFKRIIAQVVDFVEAPGTGLALPLDLRGTVFQQKVWKALCEIPAGETVSYQQVAERIGSPKSVRAVASACAANKIAVAIPCHRVLRIDGSLSGYRWGVERKRALLQREADR